MQCVYIPLVNIHQMVMVDSHTFLSFYKENKDSFCHHRMEIAGQPTVIIIKMKALKC